MMLEADALPKRGGDVEDPHACLLRRLRDGDAQACGELYDRFARGIRRFAAAQLRGDALTAEDVVVQTLVDAVRNIGRFNSRKSSFAVWVYGIARRQVLGELRRRKRLKAVPPEAQVPLDAAPEIADGRDLASEVAARLDAQRQVAVLAGFMSHEEMEVLTLQCADELQVREIARIVGRSERAVHSLLYRVRQKARERLVRDAD